jgi:Alr-MurF fusion protein
LKLNLSYQEIAQVFKCELSTSGELIDHVVIDSRRILSGTSTIFFAFPGSYRDGHEFIADAYNSGVRLFVVSQRVSASSFPEAQFIEVPSTLEALQLLAAYHRSKFNCPVIGITGSAGKTTVKEILGHLLQDNFKVTRSPKSYNSQLGVALSLLEITSETEVALIEAGISHPGEMERLEKMIHPSIGILTSIGSAHSENFLNRAALLEEKRKLFVNCSVVFYNSSVTEIPESSYVVIDPKDYISLLKPREESAIMSQNAALAIACAKHLGLTEKELETRLAELRPIAMRLETFEGIRNSLIINDTYNLDEEGLRAALDYQLVLSGNRKRMLYVGTSIATRKEQIKTIATEYQPIDVYFADEISGRNLDLENKVVLIKGDRASRMERIASSLRQQKHETYLEIDLNAVRDNIGILKQQVPTSVKVLAMVKASSYGSGAERLADFLQRTGVAYLGVAYPDEGAELRKAGIDLPIMVMNVDQGSFDFCIEHELEPAMFNLDQLDAFIRELIYQGKLNYPIHIKLETGMNRLGFHENDLEALIELLQAQPEVRIQSVYSHLATADDPNSNLVHQQAKRFEEMSQSLMKTLSYPFLRHLLNSEGILNYSQYHFDMIRVGIAMYGITTNAKLKQNLKPVVRWCSSISQVKQVKAGENIGYGGHASLDHDGKIAVIPVGYADGYRRILGNGNGGVIIKGQFCKVIGNVCMDMIMVDVSTLHVKAGDTVELIGEHQTLEQLAISMETIPYEVLTGISKRVHRVYLEA